MEGWRRIRRRVDRMKKDGRMEKEKDRMDKGKGGRDG